MLSLIEMFSARPAPVKGGRIIRGYAMSGCKESIDIGLPSDMEIKIAAAKAEAKARSKAQAEARKEREMSERKASIARRFEALMLDKGWVTTEYMAKYSGVSKSHILIALSGLADAGLIVKRALRNQKNQTKFEWSWKK